MEEVTSSRSSHQPRDPIHEATLWTLRKLKEATSRHPLDEETFSAFILSGLYFTAPLFSAFLGRPEKSTNASWGIFNKSGGGDDPLSETSTGADFCFVLGRENEFAEVGFFQAKHLKADKPRTLNVRHGPSETSEGNTQLAVLLGFACRLMASTDAPGFAHFKTIKTNLDAAAYLNKQKEGYITDLTSKIEWVHHIIYHQGEPTAIPLSKLDRETIIAEVKRTPPRSHKITHMGSPFSDLILQAFDSEGSGWLRIQRSSLDELLPALAEISTVIVSDDRGGRALVPKGCSDLTPALDLSGMPHHANRELWESLIARPARPRTGP
ncbi:hypothetical protein [Stenotrophomonas maltophilia]|uniref:hypothetical protein n=1 Tax=Stenotrophomonas maltophilia TaxID=40324 RepID=UPI001FA790F7|nr:hypothetical protein [Stenotrophomonas maltophilia]